MRKSLSFLAILGLVGGMFAAPAQAIVSVSPAPQALVTSPVFVKSSSGPIALFSFSISATEGETLSQVAVEVLPSATTTVSSSDIASLAVYKDGGDGNFSALGDTVVGTQTAVSVGSSTMVSVASSTAAAGKFFVALSTGSSWSDASPGDKIIVHMHSNGIYTSATSTPTTTAVSTAALVADTTAPLLVSAIAKNTGGTDAKEVGDSIELTFSEPTTKPAITAANIASYFTVNNSHSFLSASGTLGSALWDAAGTKLTITLDGSTSSTSSLASIALADAVTVNSTSTFSDLAGNAVSGTQSVTGSFAGAVPGTGGEEEAVRGSCTNALINGRLYKISGSQTVYLAAACRLKPFRGQAVFKARGQKFGDNIIVLATQPANVTISDKPVLPAAGTLVKGSDKTVWFVTKDGVRRGFVSGKKFQELGFAFNKVQQISDSDLNLIPSSVPIEENESHPDGSLIKCTASPAIYQVIGKAKFPFSNAEAFKGKGHTFEHVLVVDCGMYQYPSGAPITQ